MTNYRGNFLYGFIACGPYEALPEWVFDKVFCPAVETDPDTGEAKVAQVGLRRVESALLQGYKKDEVFVANPDFLEKSIFLKSVIISIVYCVSSGVSSGQPIMIVAAGNQWFLFKI